MLAIRKCFFVTLLLTVIFGVFITAETTFAGEKIYLITQGSCGKKDAITICIDSLEVSDNATIGRGFIHNASEKPYLFGDWTINKESHIKYFNKYDAKYSNFPCESFVDCWRSGKNKLKTGTHKYNFIVYGVLNKQIPDEVLITNIMPVQLNGNAVEGKAEEAFNISIKLKKLQKN